MARWTHRQAGFSEDPNDRQVLADGKPAGRIYRRDHGPQAGRWQWFGGWSGPGNSGLADSLDEALAALRVAWQSREV